VSADSGFIPVAQATEEAALFLDAQVEVPPANSGRQALPRLAAGDSVQFQIFMPAAGGWLAYGLSLAFSDSAGAFSDRFEIGSVRSDFRPPAPGGGAPAAADYTALSLDTPRGSRGSVRSILFPEPWTLSSAGLVAVLTLRARQDVDPALPMSVEARVTVLSRTPPERLIQFLGATPVRWQ
jgi:hypothetical protein